MISAVVWAMSALAIYMVTVAVYFAIFFFAMIAIFWPIAYFWRMIFKFLTFNPYDTF